MFLVITCDGQKNISTRDFGFPGSVVLPALPANLFVALQNVLPVPFPTPIAFRYHQGGVEVEDVPSKLVSPHVAPTNTFIRCFPLASNHFPRLFLASLFFRVSLVDVRGDVVLVVTDHLSASDPPALDL